MAIKIKSVSYKCTGVSNGYPRISVTITTNLSSYYCFLACEGWEKGKGSASNNKTITIDNIGFNIQNKKYTLDVYVNADQKLTKDNYLDVEGTDNASIVIYTVSDFSWELNGYIGTNGKTYMNNYDGNGKPAPVTAQEWNRFCDIASVKEITITRAAQGGSMLAAVQSASNKLGVQLPEGNKVTLQFFTDLAEALNSK